MSLSSSSRPTDTGSRNAGKSPVSGPHRLPSTRERRPALAALAVILILLGAAGSALIALRSGDREYFVAVRTDIPQGKKLAENDLARASFAGDTKALVPWSEAKSYVGRYATTKLFQNQPITRKNFTDSDKPEIPAGGALVGLSLEQGKLPSDGIDGGDIVRVIRVPVNNSEGAPVVLVNAALVTASEDKSDKKTTTTDKTEEATILVPADKAAPVGGAAATKSVVLVKLPPNTKLDIAPATGGR
ncbi:hypothetical protein [Kribbella deserti]|uniref:SAF domain-containing protein n=1 Tax=Kribbella deserti TaxID=1926257 RepID=A0ABV6QL43_9ACTN